MKERLPMPSFGIPQIDDADELPRRTVLPEKLVQMGVLEPGVRAGLPVRRNGRVGVRVLLGGCALFNINSGRLVLHALCSATFLVERDLFARARCLSADIAD